jgi:hypothetical protein
MRKLESYAALKTIAPPHPNVQKLSASLDKSENDFVDSSLLNELIQGRVDLLISEDRGIQRKATVLGLESKVYTIDAYLEKVTAENPNLADYNVLSVRKEYFGNINLTDTFFQSFREDYDGFDEWYNKKADELAYVCHSDDGTVVAFLYLKPEDEVENYSDIHPIFAKKRRLKIGTFKVVANGYKLGERFLKIIFDNATLFGISEIYTTLFERTDDQARLKSLLLEWGFLEHGKKQSKNGEETVLVREFSGRCSPASPKSSYPFVSFHSRKFIVPIYPDYHTELLPDSVLRTESPLDYVENRPNRNAISKVYISRSLKRDLTAGDLIISYRTKSNGSATHTSVATTVGVVESVHHHITSLDHFVSLCRKRSVFSDSELEQHWNYNRGNRPFVVNFLYLLTFPHRLNLKALLENGIIREAPRGFEPLTDEQFNRLCHLSRCEVRYLGN